MSANPRKFSEKIQLLKLQQHEADAAFSSIMKEVGGFTKTTSSSQQSPIINVSGIFQT